MKKPVLYFVIGMLMHTPVISQPNEEEKEYKKIAFSRDCAIGSLCLFDVKIPSKNLNVYPQRNIFYK